MNAAPSSLPRFWLRLLTFRATPEEYENLNRRHLIAGIVACWIVGIGRYWDDPRANMLQHTGLGSVAYIFVLAAVLWLIAKPTAPDRFTYVGILTFVSLTAPPAALYAIPVEKWMPLEDANQMNLRFLGLVALWRVVLWGHYLRRQARFSGGEILAVAIMPLAIIFLVLTELNLHHVVFNIMGGIRDADKSSQDAAYSALFAFGLLSIPVSLLASLGWLGMVVRQWRGDRDALKSP